MQPKKKPCYGEICKGNLAFIWKNEVTEDGVRRYCQRCWKLKTPTSKPTTRQAVKRTPHPIAKRSSKRQKEEMLYSILSKQYLKDHPTCEAKIPGVCSGSPSNQVHHKKGRIGELLLDTRYFLATEDNCHKYIEEHPDFAKEQGFSLSRLTKEE